MAQTVSQTGSINGLEAKFVDVEGVRTRYYEEGSGPPVVLCHGAGWTGGSSANTWAYNIPGLAEHFHVFAADKLGSGMTGNPESADEYTIEAQVAHWYAFMRAVGLERAHLIGQSRGAYPVARLAMEHPELVECLVLCDTATLAPDVGDATERRAKLAEEAARTGRTLAQLMSSVPENITEEATAAADYMENLPKAQETKAQWKSSGEQLFNRTLAEQKAETLQWIKEGRLQCPTLVYWGRDDNTAILPQGLQLFDLISEPNPRTRMIIVNRAGHFHFREYPDEWNHNVTSFLTQW